jgi:uncharacterized protein YqkB
MKESIENKIKESLKGHEMPYDATAWTSMSARLDKSMPIQTSSNVLKWLIGGAAVVVTVGISALYLLNNDASEITKKETTQTAKTEQEKTVGSEQNIDKSIPKQEAEQTAETNTPDLFEQVFATQVDNQETSSTSLASELIENGGISVERIVSSETPNDANQSGFSIKIPTVGSICIGESITIENTNQVELTIGLNDDQYTIASSNTLTFTPKNTGAYSISYTVNADVVNSPYFTVKPSPRADFQIDMSDKYDQGVPTTLLSASSGDDVTYSWLIDGNQAFTGTNVKAHFFSKGNHDVELTVKNESNGCEVSAVKTIRIDEDYTLLATNTFTSTSTDPRKSTFMPYALKVRNVDFKLTIIDPSNGAIVYETTDASEGWNGIDKRNGQLVDSQKPFVWVVRLMNPLPGEQLEYKSTVIRLN